MNGISSDLITRGNEATVKYLAHHGILGQKWGVKNGPPYPLSGGDYSDSEIKAINYNRRLKKNSIYNKKHFDTVLSKKKTTLTTLSYDKDRTKNSDMFYATYKRLDKHQYNALFNRAMPTDVFDENGKKIGTDMCFKFRIDNNLKHDMKIASEDTGANEYCKLFKENRDFYNFVMDKNRMQSYFVKDKYKFKGYREAAKSLEKMRTSPDKIDKKDVKTTYRMFNYIIPYDGSYKNDTRGAHDVKVQRTKFFNELKKDGYGGVLDTNDAIYGAFKAESPVIVFDTMQVVPKDSYRVSLMSKQFSKGVFVGRKALGI